MLFEIQSNKNLEAIDLGLQEAAARHQFGIITVHNLKETMAKKGVEFDGECLVYEVCNPHQAKKVLEANGAVSTALPCRISVYRSGGRLPAGDDSPHGADEDLRHTFTGASGPRGRGGDRGHDEGSGLKPPAGPAIPYRKKIH